MEKSYYPNIEYNKTRRRRFWLFYILLVIVTLGTLSMFLAMDNGNQWYFSLIMVAFLILGTILIPGVLRDHPTKQKPVLVVKENELIVMGKPVKKENISRVKAIIFVGSVGDAIKNKAFLEEIKGKRPMPNMLGSIEIVERYEEKKVRSLIVNIVDVTEAFTDLLKQYKVHSTLGYSLNKLYVGSTFNVKELMEEKEEKTVPNSQLSDKQKRKQLI